jgi:hypothetical protein
MRLEQLESILNTSSSSEGDFSAAAAAYTYCPWTLREGTKTHKDTDNFRHGM